MEYICNITFVSNSTIAHLALDFLRDTFMPAVNIPPASSPRLTRVRQNSDEAVSYAMEMKLSSFRELKEWRDSTLAPALAALSQRWGENLMYFETILEVIPAI